MDYINTDKSGRINYTEFIASCLDNSVIYKEENIMGVFRMLDKDGNGVVEASELKEALERKFPIYLEKDIGVDPKIIMDIIKDCDVNGDGMIDYKEFLTNVSQIGGI
jgi:calcium-dependent protein kinase